MLFWSILIVTTVISLVATLRVKAAIHHWSRVRAASGETGAECARRILSAAGIHDVDIVPGNSFLGDHYDPIHKRLVLSPDHYRGSSVAALGIAAHECGHAIQHKIAYKPLTWRMASVGATTYANQLVTWLPLIFLFTGGFGHFRGVTATTYLLFMAGGWGVIMLFNLITLPVEFDASRRAVLILDKMNFLADAEERAGVKKVLTTAGWTYVAAFITSLLYTLYYLLPLLLGNRRN
ncbi:MAG: zinc metallopeptidase [Verrucomicrobiales bacterium]|jgi:Zn-dependent membrane protease YugP|nr:zinc metallopeptidase [Verrucomicrobiales bacterium]